MDSSDKAIAAYKILMKSEPDRAISVKPGTRFATPNRELRLTGYYFADPRLGQIHIAIDENTKTVYYWQSES